MKISEILLPERILAEFSSETKEGIIKELISLFKNDERVIDIAEVEKVVLERESVMSTGVGNGFAIPHGKTNAIRDMIIGFGKSSKPLDFQALDGNPVNLVFLVVGKENMVSSHIKILSRISRMMNNKEFRAKLGSASSREEIYKLISEEEKKYLT